MESGVSGIDLSSACWEKSEREERINELERIGYNHVACPKTYIQKKVEEVLSSYNQNHKNSKITVKDLIILNISENDLYWVFYPKNFD